MTKPKFYALDFFCGAGGTTRGLIDAGGHVIAGIDKEGECRKTFEANNVNPDGSNSEYWQMDIYRKDETDYPEGQQQEILEAFEAKVRPLLERDRDVPLLLSICAPCQPFTTMTKIQMSDERSTARARDRGLLHQCLDYVDAFDPEIILCENVAGIRDRKYGGVWQHFMKELADRGFVVGSELVDASNFGIPQHRKRSIMLAVHERAIRNGSYTTEDGMKMLQVPLKDEAAPKATVGDTISRFPAIAHGEKHPSIPNHRASGLQEINIRRLQAVRAGETNLAFDGTDMALECHKRLRKDGANSGFTDVYTRMDPNKASPTITTKCFSVSNGRFGHPTQTRAISVREAAALQTFPDDYEFFAASIGQQARMVGNAVPPLLSEFFARHLLGEYLAPFERQSKPLPVDENGCHTLPNGDCVSDGVCMHTEIAA